MFSKRSLTIALVFFVGLNIPVISVARATEAKDVVATQLHAQGIPCTAPSKATHDIPDSSRDEMAWIITCKEATYRVKLIPHVGSKVDIIDATESGTDAAGKRE